MQEGQQSDSLTREAVRLNQVAIAAFEGSIALTAGAAAIAFTQSGTTRTLAFVVTGLCALPGFTVGWLLLWDPLARGNLEEQQAALELKRACVSLAMKTLLAGVPFLALLAGGVLFFPGAVNAVLAAVLSPAVLVGVVLGVLNIAGSLGVAREAHLRSGDFPTPSAEPPASER